MHTKFEPAHAYVAVDFFFCLSGFVIAYAYENRLLSGMTLWDFSARRLIRLYPLILMGILLGYAALVSYQIIIRPPCCIVHRSVELDTLLLGPALVLIPLGLLFHLGAFPLNGPIWSLFFEVFANFLYAVERRRIQLSERTSSVLLLAGALVLMLILKHHGTMRSIGFGNGILFVEGFARVFCPFLAGVLIFRMALFNHVVHLAAPLIAIFLLAVLFLPIARTSWIYDSIAVIVICPLIVALGAKPIEPLRFQSFWELSGRLSYPFYIVHVPVLLLFSIFYARIGFLHNEPYLTAALGLVAAGAVAYVAVKFYDEPTRAWLSSRYQSRLSRVSISNRTIENNLPFGSGEAR